MFFCSAPVSLARNLAAAESEGGQKFSPYGRSPVGTTSPNPLPFCPPGAYCAPRAPKYYDLKLVSYYSPCTGICPRYYVAPYTIADSVYGSSYNWSVGKILNFDGTSGTAPDGSYTVQVCQTGTSVCDSSDSYFKIVSGTTTDNLPL